jgi:hypothetical protein
MNIHGKSPYLIRFNISCLIYDAVCTLTELVHPLISEITFIGYATVVLALLIALLVTALLTVAPGGQLISQAMLPSTRCLL